MKPGELFSNTKPDENKHAPSPLADRMRPRSFDEFVGQRDLLAAGRPLRQAIETDTLQSTILWGREDDCRATDSGHYSRTFHRLQRRAFRNP